MAHLTQRLISKVYSMVNLEFEDKRRVHPPRTHTNIDYRRHSSLPTYGKFETPKIRYFLYV